jgi:hypothetical protein
MCDVPLLALLWPSAGANNDPKTASTVAQKVSITLLGAMALSKTVHVWHTTPNASFVNLGPFPVNAGMVALSVEPESIYTVTSTTGQSRGSFPAPPAASAPFPTT